MADDAADHDGRPTRVALRLFTTAAPGGPVAFRCELALEAADTYSSASPTFSPDGSRVAWAESDGIHVAALGALGDCAAIREQVVTLPGAWEPYWTPASEPAPPAGQAPVTTRLTLALTTRARPLRATLRRRGVRARLTISAPATVRLSLRIAGTRHYLATVTRKLADAGTTTVRLRLRAAATRTARRLVLRASAPGAAAVEVTIRPRRPA